MHAFPGFFLNISRCGIRTDKHETMPTSIFPEVNLYLQSFHESLSTDYVSKKN